MYSACLGSLLDLRKYGLGSPQGELFDLSQVYLELI